MAGVVVFLSAAAGAYVTGAVIPVDGGIWTYCRRLEPAAPNECDDPLNRPRIQRVS